MNEELHSILLNLPEGIVLIDNLTKKINLINQEFKRIFGIKEVRNFEDAH